MIDRRSGARRSLGIDGIYARYIGKGRLLCVTREGQARAVPFDTKRAAVTGTPVAVLRDISLSGNEAAILLKGASASNEIVEYAEKEKMNLIIIGARGMSEQARFHLGAETPKVVKYAPCCVYVVKESCLEFCAV